MHIDWQPMYNNQVLEVMYNNKVLEISCGTWVIYMLTIRMHTFREQLFSYIITDYYSNI